MIKNLFAKEITFRILCDLIQRMEKGSSKNYVDKKRWIDGQQNVHYWSRDILQISRKMYQNVHSRQIDGQKSAKSCPRNFWTTPKQTEVLSQNYFCYRKIQFIIIMNHLRLIVHPEKFGTFKNYVDRIGGGQMVYFKVSGRQSQSFIK